MGFTVQPTLTISLDNGAVLVVDQMSTQAKDLVRIMDVWRQEESDYSLKLAMARAAIRDIQGQLLQTIEKERVATTEKQETA